MSYFLGDLQDYFSVLRAGPYGRLFFKKTLRDSADYAFGLGPKRICSIVTLATRSEQTVAAKSSGLNFGEVTDSSLVTSGIMPTYR